MLFSFTPSNLLNNFFKLQELDNSFSSLPWIFFYLFSPYQFTVPEYMYHEVFNPDAQTDAYERPRRALYGFDNVSAFEREGKGVTDKTVKLPEVIKPGYGVRSGKPLRMKKQPPAPAGVKTVQQVSAAKMVDDGRPRLKYLPM